MKRKEDARFIRGQGNYVDDINLPGMLHSAILRSPLRPRAASTRIDTSAAEALPGVVGGHHRRDARDRASATTSRGCRRSPATPRPCSRPTRCASRARRSRSSSPTTATSAKDALELIDVDYEPLPPVDGRQEGAGPGRPASSATTRGQTDNSSRCFRPGRPATRTATDAARSPRPTSVVSRTSSTRACTRHRWRPAAGRRHGPGHRQADDLDHEPGTARPPHGVRHGRRAPRAQDPHHLPRHRRRLRQQGAVYPGYVAARSWAPSSPASR